MVICTFCGLLGGDGNDSVKEYFHPDLDLLPGGFLSVCSPCLRAHCLHPVGAYLPCLKPGHEAYCRFCLENPPPHLEEDGNFPGVVKLLDAARQFRIGRENRKALAEDLDPKLGGEAPSGTG